VQILIHDTLSICGYNDSKGNLNGFKIKNRNIEYYIGANKYNLGNKNKSTNTTANENVKGDCYNITINNIQTINYNLSSGYIVGLQFIMKSYENSLQRKSQTQ